MKRLASNVPFSNLYAMKALTDLPMPLQILPPELTVREVCEGNVRGEWTEPSKHQTSKTHGSESGAKSTKRIKEV